MRSVTCPDCGAQVEIPVVTVGDESVIVYCKNCLWRDLDQLYGRRGLVVFSGDVAEMACWTCVGPGNGLQAAIDALGSGGGNLMLQPGTYTGDITFSGSGNISLYGSGRDSTILTGSVLIQTNQIHLDNLWIKATGKSYGVKIFKSGAGPNRNEFRLVRIGGTTSSSDGPTGHGLWLDGGILNVFDHCLFAFNGGNGVYVNTSDVAGVWSTNVNTFRDCTINANDAYGVKTEIGADAVAGMQQHLFLGGNIENNASGAAYIEGSIFTRFDDVDFEDSIDHGSSAWLVQASSSTYVIIENCNFTSTGNTGRAFAFFSCGYCRVVNNRIQGSLTRMDVGIFDENCAECVAYGNAFSTAWINPATGLIEDLVTPRWVANRGQNRGWSA